MALHTLSTKDATMVSAAQVLSDVVDVVRELVENSLDSGASRIEVTLDGHGLDCLTVIDTGKGISTADLPMLGKQSVTSKIDSLESLKTRLTSYGYRGEALHALATFSTSVVVQSAKQGSSWYQVTLGNSSQAPSLVSSPPRFAHEDNALEYGTKIEVRGLLSHLPVRRNQAKERSADLHGRIIDLITAYSIAHYMVHFTACFRNPPSPLLVRDKQPDMFTSLMARFGPDFTSNLEFIPRELLPFGLTITCILPKPVSVAACFRPRKDRMFMFVNGRPVQLKSIATMLNARLRSYANIQGSKCAPCVIAITSPPNLIRTAGPDKTTLYFQNHVEHELLARFEALLQQRYPLPLESVVTDTQQYIAGADELPSTQPALNPPIVPPVALKSPAKPAAVAPTRLSAIANSPPHSTTAISPPRPLAAAAATVTSPSDAVQVVNDSPPAASSSPAGSKRRREEKTTEEPPVVLSWSLDSIASAFETSSLLPALPPVTLNEARKATLLCCPTQSVALVRAASSIYCVNVNELCDFTSLPAGTPVSVLLLKLSALQYPDGRDVFCKPVFRLGAPLASSSSPGT